MPRRKVTREIYEAVTADWNAGSTRSQLARRYGLCFNTVSRIVRRQYDLGALVTRAGPSIYSHIPEPTRADIIAEHSAGARWSELAERYGLPWPLVLQILRGGRPAPPPPPDPRSAET